jgi:hypothetical protein
MERHKRRGREMPFVPQPSLRCTNALAQEIHDSAEEVLLKSCVPCDSEFAFDGAKIAFGLKGADCDGEM